MTFGSSSTGTEPSRNEYSHAEKPHSQTRDEESAVGDSVIPRSPAWTRDEESTITVIGGFLQATTRDGGQLGDREGAERAVRELLTQKPNFAALARDEWAKWLGHGETLEHQLEGLGKAGLDIPPPVGADEPRAARR